MGNCHGGDKTQQIFDLYPKEVVKKHLIAESKLNYLQKRSQQIKQKSEKDIQQIKKEVLNRIHSTKSKVMAPFHQELQQLNKHQQNKKTFLQPNQNNQDYLGIIQAEKDFVSFEERKIEAFNTIRDQMDANRAIVLKKIEDEIKCDIVEFHQTEKLSQQQIHSILSNIKRRYKLQQRQAQQEVEDILKTELNLDYYKQQLQEVASSEQLMQMQQMKPYSYKGLPGLQELRQLTSNKGWCVC